MTVNEYENLTTLIKRLDFPLETSKKRTLLTLTIDVDWEPHGAITNESEMIYTIKLGEAPEYRLDASTDKSKRYEGLNDLADRVLSRLPKNI